MDDSRLHAEVRAWMHVDPDPNTRAELAALLGRAEEGAELRRRFARRLAFGTAGLRGLMGAGPGRMNRLVVRQTTAGLGEYLLARIPDSAARGVVIGFDARHGSRQFAADAAGVLGGMGIVVHLFDDEIPTPLGAFAVKELKAAAGIVITASHNPPAYNGYKVYWGDGAQITPPHDEGIARAIDRAAKMACLPWAEKESLAKEGLLRPLGASMTERYLRGLEGLSLHPRSAASGSRAVAAADPALRAQIRIAYTPLHGVGAQIATEALQRAGFHDVHTVAEQREPDGSFPTVAFPNPEEAGAMDAVLALAAQVNAVLACANDPDADRLCVAVRSPNGSYEQLTGDQLGILLGADRLHAIFPAAHAQTPIAAPEGESSPASADRPVPKAVATTIVSSELLPLVAAEKGARCDVTLTGFKWLAKAAAAQRDAGYEAVFAYEEALGYCVGDLVADKDGISALVSIAELAAALAARGETLLDALGAIYRRHGLFVGCQQSVPLDPHAAAGPTAGSRLRAQAPTRIAGRSVLTCADLHRGEERHADGTTTRISLPTSDVLIYRLEGDVRIIVRPSGTEPKLKCYYELRVPVSEQGDLRGLRQQALADLDALVQAHQTELASLMA